MSDRSCSKDIFGCRLGLIRWSSRRGPRSLALLQNHHLTLPSFLRVLLMRQQSAPLHSFLSRCLYIYAILATTYTLGNLCSFVLRHQFFRRNRLLSSPAPRMTLPPSVTVQQAEEFLWSNFSLSSHLVTWNPILSRAFPRLMHPSRIIPHYYRATGCFESDDITVTTLISSDRFPVFRNLVRKYKGVTVATICFINPP